MKPPEPLRSLRSVRVLRMVAVAAAVTVLARASPATEPGQPTARQILDRVDDLFRGESSHGRASMTVVTEHWERTLTLEFWSKGKELSLIRILEPKKEKGTATLKSGNELWNFLPKVKRVIKLPSSMMSASWMGSHFTNDDLVKESRMTEEYSFEISFEGEREGVRVIELTLHPHEDAAVVWGEVVVVVRAEDYLPVRVSYYDEDGDLARTLTYYDVREIGGRVLPVTMRMVPADEPDEKTEVSYESIEFDVGLDDGFFSLRNLQQ